MSSSFFDADPVLRDLELDPDVAAAASAERDAMRAADAAGDEHVHRHREYRSVSMTASRVCSDCGQYVASDYVPRHNEFHDRLDAIEAALQSAGVLAVEAEPTLF